MKPINISKIPILMIDKAFGTSQEISPKTVKIPRGSGYLGSVKEMKKSLEDLFNKS